MNRGNVFLILLVLLAVYFIYTIYPFYQRYWASITYGSDDAKKGKRYVKNLETIAYGLSFDDAEKLATELRKPGFERKAPDILNFKQYLPDISGLDKQIVI